MSMTPLSLDALRELVPAYVLGALDADERERFEQGLREPAYRDVLLADVTAQQAAIDAIVTAQAEAPPPDLKARAMARFAASANASANTNANGSPAAASALRGESPTPAVPPADATVLPLRPRPSRAGWYAAAAATTGLAATAIFSLSLRERVNALEAEVQQRGERLAEADSTLAAQKRTLATLLAGRGNVVLVNLDATAPTGPGMQVFWNVRDGTAVVNAYGLAQVKPDRAYMLWMIRDGKPVPLKLFTPDSSGRALVADVTVPTNTAGITLLAVTEESAQGADAPTMQPFIAGAVPATR